MKTLSVCCSIGEATVRPFRFHHHLVLLIALWVASVASAQTPPVAGFFLGQDYVQFLTMVVPDSSEGTFWEGWATGFAPEQATRTYVVTPPTNTVTLNPDLQGAWLKSGFKTVALRNAKYPAGAYEFHQEPGPGAPVVISANLAGGAAPASPVFQSTGNWMALQPNTALDVAWQAGAGTLPSDQLQLVLEDTHHHRLFATPFPGQAGALTISSTGIQIPAVYFTPGMGYLLRLTVYRVAGSSSVSGWTVLTGAAVCTKTSLLVQGTPLGTDVSTYQVRATRVFTQSGNQPPAPATTDAFRGEALVTSLMPSGLLSASLSVPGKALRVLANTDGVHSYAYGVTYASETALSSDWPQGTYQWTFGGISGTNQISQQFPGLDTWPTPLQVTNWTDLVTLNPTNRMSVKWALPPGALATNAVELDIMGPDGTSIYSLYSSLPGTTTAIELPAGTLNGGTDYEGRLRYIRVLDTDTATLPGATGSRGYCAETRFAFRTAGRVVPPGPLAMLPQTLLPSAVGAYVNLQFAAQAGVSPYVWSMSAGSLPSSLQFDPSSGSIRGTPTEPGTYSFALRLQDAALTVVTQAYSLSVTGALAALEITDTNLPPIPSIASYLTELGTAGGALPVTWSLSAGQLPPGIALSPLGFLVGTAQKSGIYSFELTARDAAGQSAKRTFSIQAPQLTQAAPLQITSFKLVGGRPQVTLNVDVDDPVSILASSNLVNWEPVFASNYPSNGWQGPLTGGASTFYQARLGVEAAPPTPTAVFPMLNTNNTAEFILNSTGGSLTLTGSLGQVFKLEFPSNAVVSDVLVRMTEIPAFAGLPFTGQYCGGVELLPSGLAFFNPGKLTITTPGRIPRGFTSFATGPAGSDLHLHPAWPVASNAVVLPILHFTDYGGAESQPGEAEAQAQKDPCKTANKWQQAIAAILKPYYDAFFGSDQPPAKQYPDRSELWPPLKEWFNQSVWPNLKAAETDVEALDEAVSDFGTWARELELLDVFDSTQWQQLIDNGATGLTPDQKALLEAGLLRKKCFPVLTKAFANAIVKTHVRAIEENNPWIIPNVVGYAKAAQLWGIPADLLPDFFSLEAVLDRVARVFRFDLEIQSHIQITVPKGTDSEQIRSGRAPIELDFSSAAAVPLSLNTLIKRFSTNIDLVSLDLKVDGTWRPVLQTGKLKFNWLKLIPEYDEPANPNDCPPPKPSEKPRNVRVYCAYKVTDPVPTMEVYSELMGWISAPADMWGSAYPLLHDDELINIIDPYNPDGDPLESVMPKPDQWNYLGGQIVARATYDRTKPAKGGQATETTELLLRFAPKPLRPKDTQIPDLSK